MPDAPPRRPPGGDGPRWLSPVLTLGAILVLLGAVSFLPPDTSLSELHRSGVLRACLPDSYPPLVTEDADRPGIDVELLRVIAGRMGLRLALNQNAAIGRDINPRNWRITRAQCQIIAGGVIASTTTRSYLDTTPAYLEIGWAVVRKEDVVTLEGTAVGFHAGLSGFDRIALARFLRDHGSKVSLVRSRGELVAGLAAGDFALGVTESLAAREIAAENDWTVEWLGDALPRYPVALGLWKGDLTLKRRLDALLAEIEADGTMAALLDRYDLTPITGTFGTGKPGGA